MNDQKQGNEQGKAQENVHQSLEKKENQPLPQDKVTPNAVPCRQEQGSYFEGAPIGPTGMGC